MGQLCCNTFFERYGRQMDVDALGTKYFHRNLFLSPHISQKKSARRYAC